MSLRETIRRYRLYYKSGKDFRNGLQKPGIARLLPFLGNQGTVNIALRSGRSVDLPVAHWDLLPSICRLDQIGASVEVLSDVKRVTVGDTVLYSPLWTRAEPGYYKEVFIDDIYGTRDHDRSGQIVVDVGAYVGDSAVAFARAGATVHAFEPLGSLAACIARNAAANGLAERIVVHAVGLSEADGTQHTSSDVLHFVEGIAYVLNKLPANIDVLKIDCEGAEYYLFGNPAFLKHLHPAEIRMEYHRGPELLATILRDNGYRVEYNPADQGVGLMQAYLNA